MRTMPIREFLRGGYHELTEMTVVTRHGQTLFTAMPYLGVSRETAENGLKSAQDLVERLPKARKPR